MTDTLTRLVETSAENQVHIAQYLEMVAEMTRATNVQGTHLLTKFMIDYGHAFSAVRTDYLGTGTRNACWHNSVQLALCKPEEFRYVEGWAIAHGDMPLPTSHGWCVDRQGNVVEATWQGAGVAYFGIGLREGWTIMAAPTTGGPILEGNQHINSLINDTNGERERALLSWDDWLAGNDEGT